MIELKNDSLVFSFPDVHKRARASVHFQRTLRIPDDGKTHRLPPGLGRFPLRHVDDFADRLTEDWLRRGGVMLPMYQAEALWIYFGSGFAGSAMGWDEEADDGWIYSPYPFAVKVAAGKIDAVTGKRWSNGLQRRPQDYVALPNQPWLDGFCVKKGLIRQFVAMPLGAGYTAEEQITGAAEHGGLQIVAYPMKPDVYERRFPPRRPHRERRQARGVFLDAAEPTMALASAPGRSMGLAPGGKMRQKIYPDPFDFSDWDTENGSRCFVHIANSMVWRSITGENPPTVPPTAEDYTRAGLPWFDLYDGDAKALKGSSALDGLKSVKELGEEKGDVPLPENRPVRHERVTTLVRERRLDEVREGVF